MAPPRSYVFYMGANLPRTKTASVSFQRPPWRRISTSDKDVELVQFGRSSAFLKYFLLRCYQKLIQILLNDANQTQSLGSPGHASNTCLCVEPTIRWIEGRYH